MEQIFTPEMRMKISQANMNRDFKHTSKIEQRFVDHLRSVGINAEGSKWFNFKKKTWCADVWLPDYEVTIEFDGVFFHGLDRSENYTIIQSSTMENDKVKNDLAIEHNITLLRIAENSDWKTIKTVDDLFSIAYLVISGGSVISSTNS